MGYLGGEIDGGGCALASSPPEISPTAGSSQNAFSIHDVDCFKLDSEYFLHEIGHVLGGRHERVALEKFGEEVGSNETNVAHVDIEDG